MIRTHMHTYIYTHSHIHIPHIHSVGLWEACVVLCFGLSFVCICMYVCMYVCKVRLTPRNCDMVLHSLVRLIVTKLEGYVLKKKFTFVSMYVCMCVYVCVCMYVCIHGLSGVAYNWIKTLECWVFTLLSNASEQSGISLPDWLKFVLYYN